MVELIAAKGYPAVRIADLAKLAHVSQPTFYSLYADKEELFLSAYEEVAGRTATKVLEAYDVDPRYEQRLVLAMRAWAELAAAEPEAVSLLVLGAFGAGAKALERRGTRPRRTRAPEHLRERQRRPAAPRGHDRPDGEGDPRRHPRGDRRAPARGPGRASSRSWPTNLTRGRAATRPAYPTASGAPTCAAVEARGRSASEPSERARRAEGRLPSGRSDLPRQFIVKSQQERIVDATAAIVAEKGLAALTIPEIVRRANVSNQTFYDIYPSKRDAFLGAQKVGMHQALRVAVEAYEAHAGDWPRAVGAGVHALVRVPRVGARARSPHARRHVRRDARGDRDPQLDDERVRRLSRPRL